ncbi:hypothetical protein EDC15_104247 [Acetobacter aceti NBRC 14818]|nr:hypothetical protein EDC15_104247 [Acetobacter aceti NBRC 14818]
MDYVKSFLLTDCFNINLWISDDFCHLVLQVDEQSRRQDSALARLVTETGISESTLRKQ